MKAFTLENGQQFNLPNMKAISAPYHSVITKPASLLITIWEHGKRLQIILAFSELEMHDLYIVNCATSNAEQIVVPDV